MVEIPKIASANDYADGLRAKLGAEHNGCTYTVCAEENGDVKVMISGLRIDPDIRTTVANALKRRQDENGAKDIETGTGIIPSSATTLLPQDQLASLARGAYNKALSNVLGAVTDRSRFLESRPMAFENASEGTVTATITIPFAMQKAPTEILTASGRGV